MATNWPPAPGTYPAWPPAEAGGDSWEFSSIQTAIDILLAEGYTKDKPTAAEKRDFFTGVLCDHGDPCSGIMVVSPTGVRYPFAYCTGATHKSALVLWVVGYDNLNNPRYDLGWGSGVVT